MTEDLRRALERTNIGGIITLVEAAEREAANRRTREIAAAMQRVCGTGKTIFPELWVMQEFPEAFEDKKGKEATA